MAQNKVVSREEWLVARKALVEKEKAETHLRDEVAAARAALPWGFLCKRRWLLTGRDDSLFLDTGRFG